MRNLYNEVLSIVEGGVLSLSDAARQYETVANDRRVPEKLVWELLTAVYEDRARVHQALAEKMCSQIQLAQPGIFGDRSLRNACAQ